MNAKTTNAAEETKLPFHTYMFREDKPPKVVHCGMAIAENKVKSAAMDDGYEVPNVTEFRLGADASMI